ncbi:unnamed protein product [Pedinophyceae sp. YPF-701]|nr:unnamed protein product [Pedinophyceae sp. YPF-701]
MLRGNGAVVVPARDRRQEYGAFTDKLVQLANLPFLFLCVPQILKNMSFLRSGDTAAMFVLSWVGCSTAWLGNALLLSYFASRSEKSAMGVQAIGMVSNAAVMAQLYAGGVMPGPHMAAVLAVTAVSLVVALPYFIAQRVPQWLAAVSKAYNVAVGLAGLYVIPQALMKSLSSVFPSMSIAPPVALPAAVPPEALPGVAGVLVGLAAVGMRGPKTSRAAAWAGVSGVVATLLFGLQGFAQVLNNFQKPELLVGVSVAGVLLCITGNMMMLPRAYFTKDAVWATGATWGALVTGWGQLLSMHWANIKHGLLVLSPLAFFGLSTVVFGALAAILAATWATRGVDEQASKLPA